MPPAPMRRTTWNPPRVRPVRSAGSPAGWGGSLATVESDGASGIAVPAPAVGPSYPAIGERGMNAGGARGPAQPRLIVSTGEAPRFPRSIESARRISVGVNRAAAFAGTHDPVGGWGGGGADRLTR